MRRDGFTSLERLMGGCKIDPDDADSCWIWAGARTGAGVPVIGLPAGVFGNEARMVMPAYKAAWLFTGRTIPKGHTLMRKVTCHNPLCINPDHRKTGTRSLINKTAGLRGSYNSPAREAVLWASRRKQAVSIEVVRKIEGLLMDGASCSKAAKAAGVDKCTAYLIRDGQHIHQRRPANGVSVFNWRPA